MSQTVDELFQAALSLPDDARAELAELIAASLPVSPSRLHPEWTDEIRRRVEEVESGKVAPVPWEEVRRGVHAMLDA